MQLLHDFNDDYDYDYAEETQFIAIDTALYDDYEEIEVALLLSEQNDDVLGTLPIDQHDGLGTLPEDELTMPTMETNMSASYPVLAGRDDDSVSTWTAGVTSAIHVHIFTLEGDFPFDPLEHHVRNIFHAFEPDDPAVPLDHHVGAFAEAMNWESDPLEDEASTWCDRLSSAYGWGS
ncbi:hypothetical protein FRC14_007029 [Serendipita sp. 396]|nr:hypothetical protein FRC14_007029 [Serendipita sp. 396]KAG8774211.1 hypothetical protein FRC15_001481 [Serendipita sp. 397]KAG8788799.1 hypothetical protein FRC16_001309 [Serendipita sp. 398]KAG8815311.1 hypothetical protein FRC18_001562 [Serendipita sp. 400]KAG8846734.1 hypothetical protein FRB91_000509 [Serendipita sp. 411]KAG8854755.1 hypothetical protein FRC20_000939 [Serendipita sp. 405]KAG9057198.1 hypothetical protein FS842_008218 [Serendipita sp. 407]